MTFLDELQAHIGGLIRIKTELFWYNPPHGPDASPGRICLLLDVRKEISLDFISATPAGPASANPTRKPVAAILIFVDGMSKWIWAWDEVLEIIDSQENPDGSQKIF